MNKRIRDQDSVGNNKNFNDFGILRTLIDCTVFDRRQTQRVVWRELICRDTTVFYIT
jgi:hypothetical protein